jgi:hypothetical protein
MNSHASSARTGDNLTIRQSVHQHRENLTPWAY